MSDAPPLREAKRLVRARLLARRAELSRAEQFAASAAVRARLAHLLGGTSGTMALYWPIRGEIDLRPLAFALAARGRVLALPVVVRRRAPMVFRRWRPGAPLVPGVWDIPVPPEGEAEVRPDVVVVPVVGVGAGGHRLGYGGGYYDRTLAILEPRPLVVGVGHDFVRIEALDAGEHDERLDLLVTPRRTEAFTSRGRHAAG